MEVNKGIPGSIIPSLLTTGLVFGSLADRYDLLAPEAITVAERDGNSGEQVAQTFDRLITLARREQNIMLNQYLDLSRN